MDEFNAVPKLMTGDEYKESLRDGRRVIDANGEQVDDVTKSPTFARGIDLIASYYDAQHDPATRDLTTFDDPDSGHRASIAWKVPRTVADLEERRRLVRYTTYQTLGVFGRPPDYGSLNSLGLLSLGAEIAAQSTEWAENVKRFVEWGKAGNLMSADLVADTQSDRRIAPDQKPGRLRIVERRPDGIVVYGAKPCSSVAAQAHIGTILTILSPGADPNAIIFAAVRVNSPGITMVCREGLASTTGPEDHPLDAQGEEADAMMIFDNVFIPSESVFSLGRMEMLPLYHEIGAIPLWHILTRLSIKAEIFAGTAQLIVDVLGTDSIPQVRDAVADIIQYARALTSFVIAAEQNAKLKNGVMVPDERFVTAGRLYSVDGYPEVQQRMRVLSGQGLISRFTTAQFDVPDIGERLEEFLPGTGVDARAKNRLFNFVWDLTCGSNAMRVALFENVNATPPSAMRMQIYRSADKMQWRESIREFLNIEFDTDNAQQGGRR